MKNLPQIVVAIALILAPYTSAAQHPLPVVGTYVSCDADRVFVSQDLILVSSPSASDLFRVTDTGWISITTPITWTQVRATPGRTIFVYDDLTGQFYGSTDFGATWAISGAFSMASPYVATQFYPSPISGTLFIGLNDYSIQIPGNSAIYKSTDNGGQWSNTGGGTGTSIAFSPNFRNDGTAFESYVIYHGSGVGKSTDGGNSWTFADNGLYPSFQGMPYQLAISPNFSNDQTVFAAADTGFYKTINAGNSWSKLKAGDWFTYTSYYAPLSPNYAVDQSVRLVNRKQQLELSQNGGTTWQSISLPMSTTAQVAALRVIAPFEPPAPTPPPTMPYHVYLPLLSAARIQALEIWLIANDGVGCKLYRSSNCGATWQEELVAEKSRASR